jgi:RNA polymerase sigma-70 factor, ECF subfamily
MVKIMIKLTKIICICRNIVKINNKAKRNHMSNSLHQIQVEIDANTSSLKSFALKLTTNTDDASDLFQDTVIRILANSEKFKEGTNFKAWSLTIMRNIFINDYRKKVRRNMIIDQTPNEYYINSGDRVVENEGEQNISIKELMGMVNTLPDDFRTPFMMAYEGYKYEEISEELDSPLGTIKSRIFFARKKLQKMYEERNYERA